MNPEVISGSPLVLSYFIRIHTYHVHDTYTFRLFFSRLALFYSTSSSSPPPTRCFFLFTSLLARFFTFSILFFFLFRLLFFRIFLFTFFLSRLFSTLLTLFVFFFLPTPPPRPVVVLPKRNPALAFATVSPGSLKYRLARWRPIKQRPWKSPTFHVTHAHRRVHVRTFTYTRAY